MDPYPKPNNTAFLTIVALGVIFLVCSGHWIIGLVLMMIVSFGLDSDERRSFVEE